MHRHALMITALDFTRTGRFLKVVDEMIDND